MSIVRQFDNDDLREKHPKELTDGLDWKEEMAQKTFQIYTDE